MQVLEVIDIVKNTTRNGRTPFVLTGDFNAKPNDTEVRHQRRVGAQIDVRSLAQLKSRLRQEPETAVYSSSWAGPCQAGSAMTHT
jgi:endonuclease/exonuclease/phosphatase family metal-dependent hydrolase